MPVNSVAANVLGTAGTICWTGQLLPQIWKSWREKTTDGLSEFLVLLWGIAACPLGIYAIVQKFDVALILQPQAFGALCMLSWTQCQYYGRRRSLALCASCYLGFLLVFGAFEAGMVYTIRGPYDRGNHSPVQFFGILASTLIALGLLPQYWEIYKHNEVVGISIPFMLIDLLGGVLSALSLAFLPKFNVTAGVAYALVAGLDGIVILLAIILNPRAARRRKRAAAAAASAVPIDSTPEGDLDLETGDASPTLAAPMLEAASSAETPSTDVAPHAESGERGAKPEVSPEHDRRFANAEKVDDEETDAAGAPWL